MLIQVVTLFPEMIQQMCSYGVLGSALEKKLLELRVLNPREQAEGVHKPVDDRPFGGGDGMIMMTGPLDKTLATVAAQSEAPWIVYLSPQGSPLDHLKVQELAEKKNLVLVCGRYGGIDQRVLNKYIDEEISIGDYVLSGGEMAAGVVVDAISRMVPGVLGHVDSAKSDSFSSGLKGLLEAPSFTRPREWEGALVPDILMSGHHAEIEKWRDKVSLLVTLLKRPDLLVEFQMTPKEFQTLKQFWSQLSEADKDVLGLNALSADDLDFLEDQMSEGWKR